MDIINNNFKTGQEYQGLINKVKFKVLKVSKKDTKNTYVTFLCDNGGKYEVHLETAKRLLIKQI